MAFMTDCIFFLLLYPSADDAKLKGAQDVSENLEVRERCVLF